MKELEEGTVLLQETSDAILMDLRGRTQDVNRHTEHWLVKDVRKNGYTLYNLDKRAEWKMDKFTMELYLRGNKKYNIKPMFTISEEVA